MADQAVSGANVRQAVPFFMVRDMAESVRFYVDGLGFRITCDWVVDGRLQWCWMELGEAALMLQEWRPAFRPEGQVGVGISVCFICRDAIALWREFTSRGLPAKRPFVGNSMWVTELVDPDGYRVFFESPTDVPEETVFYEEGEERPAEEPE